MSKKVLVNLDLNKNELQNVVIQNLATAPASGKAGQVYYNTSTNKLYMYDGTSWNEVGKDYVLQKATTDILGGVTIGSNININNGKISVSDASTTNKGVIEIATDSEVSTGTSEVLAINPKQLKSVKESLGNQIESINQTIGGYGDIVTHNAAEFATAAQGELADSALQSGDNISELVNDENYIKLTNISATSPISYNDTTGVISVVSGKEIPTTSQVAKIDTALQPSNIIDNLTSTSTTDALSANQGKNLNERLANVESRGRFLSSWNASTGKPATDPDDLPYSYRTGDYYIVDTVSSSGTNYRPSGSSYTGAPSTIVETEEIHPNDTYLYDGSKWILQQGSAQTVTFSSIAGQPSDNANLASALDAKITKNDAITGATHTKITYDSKGLVTSGSDLTKADIPELDYLSDDTTIDDLLPTQTGQAGKALITDGSNAYWGFATQKIIQTNPALTPAGGITTWTINTSSIATNDIVVTVKEVSTGEEVICSVIQGSGSVVIKMNSETSITAGTYKAIIIG